MHTFLAASQDSLYRIVMQAIFFTEIYLLAKRMNRTTGDTLFFDTAAAKAVSGLCTFLALFTTGHQVLPFICFVLNKI